MSLSLSLLFFHKHTELESIFHPGLTFAAKSLLTMAPSLPSLPPYVPTHGPLYATWLDQRSEMSNLQSRLVANPPLRPDTLEEILRLNIDAIEAMAMEQLDALEEAEKHIRVMEEDAQDMREREVMRKEWEREREWERKSEHQERSLREERRKAESGGRGEGVIELGEKRRALEEVRDSQWYMRHEKAER